MKRLLHVGCGSQPLPDWLQHFEEVRVDIDPNTKPHFVRDMMDLYGFGPDKPEGGFDALLASHCLEHVYPHQVPLVLKEWYRVLNPLGAVFISVPDLDGIRPDTKKLMDSELGPICGLDMFYGHHGEIPFNPYMAHHCGFIAETLEGAMIAAGFQKVQTERAPTYNLVGTGQKPAACDTLSPETSQASVA